MTRFATAAFALLAALGGVAHADSFMTSVGTGSKRAARVGPEAYTGREFSRAEAMRVAQKGARMIAREKNVAVLEDVVRRVDSATMEHPDVAKLFQRALRFTGPSRKDKFMAGYNTFIRDTSSKRAFRLVKDAVRMAVKHGKDDAAMHLGYAQVLAQKATGDARLSDRDRQTLFAEAQREIAVAAKSGRGLVREGVHQFRDYAKYYPELATQSPRP